MPFDPKLTLVLDREREIKWTMASSAKLGRLAEPPPLEDIAHRNAHRAFFALLAYLWAAVEDPDGDFAQPEMLAEYFKSAEAQAKGFAVLISALRQAGVMKAEKKTVSAPPSPAGGSSSGNGPTPSSSSARPARRTRR